jgi:hypothetical protein
MHLFIYSGAGIAQSLQRLGYRLNDRKVEVRFPVGARHFSLAHNVQIGPPCLLHNWYQGLFPKRQGGEGDHSPPSSTEVNTMWSYTSICLHRLVVN